MLGSVVMLFVMSWSVQGRSSVVKVCMEKGSHKESDGIVFIFEGFLQSNFTFLKDLIFRRFAPRFWDNL